MGDQPFSTVSPFARQTLAPSASFPWPDAISVKAEKSIYPENLAALSPGFIAACPADLTTGQALKYRPSQDGYVLYSVGWNQKDDSGKDDDWVWRGVSG